MSSAAQTSGNIWWTLWLPHLSTFKQEYIPGVAPVLPDHLSTPATPSGWHPSQHSFMFAPVLVRLAQLSPELFHN